MFNEICQPSDKNKILVIIKRVGLTENEFSGVMSQQAFGEISQGENVKHKL